jgi:hypothetical protein
MLDGGGWRGRCSIYWVTDNGWITTRISSLLRKSEQVSANFDGLLTDLKARGLLDDTLVI